MSTEQADRTPEGSVEPQSAPDWWHRDHPTFTALSGFFSGMLYVTAGLGGVAGVLRLLFSFETTERLLPWFAAAMLLVPVVLLANPSTRRFARYMLLGMVLTALVVVGVASLVLYAMVKFDS